jgi:hypothetical protein
MGALEGPKNRENSRLLEGTDLQGKLSGPKFLQRDPESRSEMVTEAGRA